MGYMTWMTTMSIDPFLRNPERYQVILRFNRAAKKPSISVFTGLVFKNPSLVMNSEKLEIFSSVSLTNFPKTLSLIDSETYAPLGARTHVAGTVAARTAAQFWYTFLEGASGVSKSEIS